MVAIVTGTGLGLERSSGWVLGSRGQLGDPNFGRYGENVYVNAATGNLMINRTDEILIGLGRDDVVTRAYNSLGNATDENADNWQMSGARRVSGLTGTANTSGSTVTRIDWDGSDTLYTYDTSLSAYVSKQGSGSYDRMTFASNVWTWTDANSRVVESYDHSNGGRITTSTDADGNALTYTYTGSLLTRIATASGERTDFTYSGNNLTQIVTTKSDASTLTRVRYTYDGSNRLSTVTTDLSPTDNSVSDGNKVVTTYTYDGGSTRVATISQTGGAVLTIAYQLVGSDYRVSTLTQTVASGTTRQTGFSYDTTNKITTITDPQSKQTKLTYDTNGQLTQIELPAAISGASAEISTFTYNSNGDVLTATDGSGNTITYTYDTRGNLTQRQDELGDTTTYTYDSTTNRLLTQTRYVTTASSGTPTPTNDTIAVTAIGDSTTFNPRLNDSDPEGDTLTVTGVSTPSHGTATYTSTSITYTRTSLGADSFTYTVNDGNGHSATATVNVLDMVNGSSATPSATNDTINVVNNNNALTFDPRINDSDADGDALTITGVSTPSHGTATYTGTSITYTRTAGGSDSFTYTISDNHGHSTTGTVSVTQTTSNSGPTATNDSVTVTGTNSLTFDPRTNDSDPDGDVLTITGVTTPGHGTASYTASSLTYTRTSSGTDTFTYTIQDGNGHSTTGTVTVLDTGSNSGPTASNDFSNASNGSSITFDPRYNDTDPDGDVLTIQSVATPTHGTATVVNGGTAITYTRTSMGSDTFSYTVSDGHGHTTTADINMYGLNSGANKAPGAHNDYITVTGTNSLTFDPRLNDADFDSADFSALTVTGVSTPSHGTATFTSTSVTYTRSSAGADTFTYTLYDGHAGHSVTATVTVSDGTTSNIAPVPVGDSIIVTGTSALTFDPRVNDTDFDVDSLTVTAVSTPSHGTATFTSTSVTYTRTGPGSDSFTYTVSDGHSHTATATVTVSDGTPANTAEIAVNDAIAVSGVGDTLTFNPRVNDKDFDLDTLTITGVTTPTYGTATYTGTSITYTRTAAGNDTFNYTISDNHGHSVTATVSVTAINGAGGGGGGGGGSPSNPVTARFAYDSENHLRFVVSELGEVTEYGYDSYGRQTSVITYRDNLYNISSLGPTDTIAESALASWASGLSDRSTVLRTDTTYDFRGNIATVTTYSVANSSGVGQTSSPYSRMTYTYDQMGNLLTRQSNGVTNSEVYVYDGLGRVTSVVDLNGGTTTTSYSDSNTRKTETFANGLSRQSIDNYVGELWVVEESGTGLSTDTVRQLIYDSRGELGRYFGTRTADGYSLFDAVGNKVADIELDGSMVEYRYDLSNRLIATIAYKNKVSSTNMSTIGSGSVFSNLSVDTARPTADTTADTWTWNIYDSANRLIETIDGNGGVTVFSYDGLSNLVSTTAYATALTSVAAFKTTAPTTLQLPSADAPRDVVTRNFYDNDGRLIGALDGKGYLTQVVYNAGGQIVDKIAFATVATITSGTFADFLTNVGTNAADVHNRSFYDNRGFLRYTLDDTLRPCEYVYDDAGHLLNKIEYAGVIGSTSTYTLSYVAAQITSTGLSTNADNRKSWMVYDAAGRAAYVIDPSGAVVRNGYDTQGQLIKQTAYAVARSTTSSPSLSTMDSWASGQSSNTANRTTRSLFDLQNRLVYSVDGKGYVTEYRYTNDKLTLKIQYADVYTVTDSTTRSDLATAIGGTIPSTAIQTSFTYNSNEVLTDSYDGVGTRTHYAYDAQGRVTDKTEGYTTALAVTTHYTYDAAGRVASETAATGKAEELVTKYTYDGQGRLLDKVEAYGTSEVVTTRSAYNALGQLASQTRANGASEATVTTFTYNAFGQVVDRTDAAGTAAETVTRYAYDDFGRVLTEKRGLGASEESTTTYSYNAFGEVKDRTESGSATTRYDYDVNGRVKTMTRALGASEETTTAYTYDAFGAVTDQTVANGTSDAATFHFVFDNRGQVITATRAPGQSDEASTSYTYDAFGEALTSVDGRGYTSSFTYDKLGHLLTSTTPIDASNTAVTTNEYDVLGNLVKSTDPRGNASFFYYDALNRLVLSVDQEKYATATTYTKLGAVATVTRYANKITGSVVVGTLPSISTNSAEDAVTTFLTDKLGRVTKVTDAEGYYEQYELNALGQRTKVWNKLTGLTTNTYDDLGRLVTEVIAMSSWRSTDTSTAQSTTVTNKFVYDGRGNRTQMIEAFGLDEVRTTNYVYDKLDRLVTTTHDQVSVVATDLQTTSTVTPTESFIYDKRGNLIESDDAAGARTLFYYDDLDRKIASINAVGTLSTWTYDDNGNATSVRVYGTQFTTLPTTPGGTPPSLSGTPPYRETTYTYDRANRLLTTTVASLKTGEYGSSYTITTANVVVSNTYDKNGNVIAQTDGRGNNSFFYYDKLGRKIAQVDQENYLTFFTLDADGNVTMEERFATALSTAPTTSSNPTTLHDTLAALANADDRITSFTYDKNGRRLTEVRTGVVAWTINTSTGALTSASTTSTITYAYNGLGEVTRKTEATGEYTDYFYDNFGRQTQIKSSSFLDYTATSVQRVMDQYYDGLNNLTRTVQNSTRTTKFSYGAGGKLASMTDAANFVHNYKYDAAGRLMKDSYTRTKADGTTTVTEASATQYDLLGRVTLQSVATWNGTAWVFGDKSQIQYNAYGEVKSKGVNIAGAVAAQETFDYDSGGRMYRSTAGDGIVKLYVYDANGKQTLMITSNGAALPSGYDWATITVDQALTLLTTGGALGAVSVAGMVVTITVMDKRGLSTQTREPLRQYNSTTGTLTHGRTYNAFGEINQQTDSRTNPTVFTYNTMGRIIQQVNPTVNWTAENGAVASAHPTVTNYYDISGRLIAVEDANGNKNKRSLLSGSGYGDDEAIVVREFHADNGVYEREYDAFDDMRLTVDEVGKTESYVYDAMSRLTSLAHQTRLAGSTGNATGSNITLTDNYVYDGLGRRTQHWNSFLTSSVKELTDYDVQGRVTSMMDFGGDTTTYAYAWDAGAVTSGLNTSSNPFGGWTKTTHNAAGQDATEKVDYFGRTVDHVDYGGHDYNYTYNLAGRLAERTNNAGPGGTTGEDIVYTYWNTGNVASITSGSLVSNYKYDEDGNRIFESTASGATSLQSSTVTWDAMNRMVSLDDTGAGGGVPVSIDWEYDKVGNIRYMGTTYHGLDNQGDPISTPYTQNLWYKYDAMNRFVISMGGLSGSRGGSSTILGAITGYTAAGQRAYTMRESTEWWYNPDFENDVSYTQDSYERYYYTADGYLADVKWELINSGVGRPDNTALTYRAKYVLDTMGRVTGYSEYNTAGTSVVYSRDTTFNNKSQTTQDVTTSVRTDGTWVSTTNYDYKADSNADGDYVDSGDAYMGVVTHYRTTTTKNGSSQPTSDMKNTFTWWDSAIQTGSSYLKDITDTGTVWNSTYTYNTSGRISSIYIADGRPRTVTFVNDNNGMVLQRDEADANSSTGDPRELHYYFGGVAVGDVSNNGQSNVNYVTGIMMHTKVPGTGPFQGGETASSGTWADFEQNYDYINGLTYQSASSHYTINDGDTLESIAYQLWGDASYWYMIADANGMAGNETLVAGMDLIIPNKIHNSHNNAGTYRVYDPNEALGDNSPTAQKPPKKHKGCGVVGQIIQAVVTIAVTLLLQAVLPGPLGFVAAAMIGDAVGQGTGLLLGNQSKFNWKELGMTAVTAAISQFSPIALPSLGNNVLDAIAQSAVNNALGQGIGVATGLQSKFDWAAVAAAGVSAGVTTYASQNLPGAAQYSESIVGGRTIGTYTPPTSMNLAVSGMAGVIANAATRSLINGSDFGDNLIASLPDVIGTIGNALAHGDGPSSMFVVDDGSEQSMPGGDGGRAEVSAARPTLPPNFENESENSGDLFADNLSGLSERQIREILDGKKGSPVDTDVPRINGWKVTIGDLSGEAAAAVGIGAVLTEAALAALALKRLEGFYDSELNYGGHRLPFANTPLPSPMDEYERVIGNGNQLGFSVEIRDQDEANLVARMVAEGKNSYDINSALSYHRTSGGGAAGSSVLKRIAGDGHAIDRHGGAVTNRQLLIRALTGVAPDNSIVLRDGQVVIPKTSTAFNSNALLAEADTLIRDKYLDRALALIPGATEITISGVDMRKVVGRGYDRVGPLTTIAGPPRFFDNLSRVTGVYHYDSTVGRWRTITIYPVK